MDKLRWIEALIGGCLLLAAGLTLGEEPTPLERVRAANQQVLALYRAETATDEDTVRAIFRVVDEVTDYDRIVEQVVAGVGDSLDDEQRNRLRITFGKVLRLAAMHKLGRYRADRFEYLSETVEGDRAEVRTIGYYGTDQVHLDYKLERIDGKWRIVNYLADDVDAVRNYRRQISRILKQESFDALIERLERRSSEPEHGAATP